jgi:ribonuclease HI
VDQNPETQALESWLLNEWEIKFFPIFHNSIHRCSKPWARNSSRVRGNRVSILTPEDPSGMVAIRSATLMSDLVAYIDGGSFGNPGPSGIGVVISGAADGTIRIARWIGQQDNNVAEYVALLEALQCALLLKAKALRVFSDSEVMVKQMSGEYRCRSPRLYSLNWICRKLAGTLDFSISHVRREDNAEANSLATSAARKRLC